MFSYAIDEDALRLAKMMGWQLLVVTNVQDMTPDKVIERYKSLADIERGFKVLKSSRDWAVVSPSARAHSSPCLDLLYGADPAPGDAYAVAGRQHRRHTGAGVAVTQTNSTSLRHYQRYATLVWRVIHDDRKAT